MKEEIYLGDQLFIDVSSSLTIAS